MSLIVSLVLPVAGLLAGCNGDKSGDSGGVDDDSGDTGVTAVDPNHDDLSMPAEPTLDPDSFTSAAECADCHPDHYAQWSRSMHAYAMVDPVYQALVGIRQADLDGTQDQFCTQCHSAIGTRGGEIVPGFSFEDLSPIVMEGITCEACHKVARIDRVYNSGHVLDPEGPIRGPLTDPEPSSFHNAAGMEYSDIFESAEFCGACHDVVEISGLPLERPYEEWTTSPGRDEGQTCQTCHMPESSGYAATDTSTVRTLHDHSFVGVDVPLLGGWATPDEVEQIRARIEELLATAATVSLSLPDQVVAGEQLDVVVDIRNDISAHNLPTGSTFLRQVWLEVIATDALGTRLYATGDLDANGDLRDYWSSLDQYGDDDLISLSSGFIDAHGQPTLFSHLATEHTSHALSPLYERTYTLFVPTEGAAPGPITVSARLRLRPFPPYLLRLLELDELIDKLEIYDLDAVVGEVSVVPSE
ncbi:MAG: hypothetical protein D6798_18585 [Deltaproteobacteria bacterium]|nr:MAG: hypothetical protein D6798_18585 [Deltaproteobacteria bacterium]